LVTGSTLLNANSRIVTLTMSLTSATCYPYSTMRLDDLSSGHALRRVVPSGDSHPILSYPMARRVANSWS